MKLDFFLVVVQDLLVHIVLRGELFIVVFVQVMSLRSCRQLGNVNEKANNCFRLLLYAVQIFKHTGIG